MRATEHERLFMCAAPAVSDTSLPLLLASCACLLFPAPSVRRRVVDVAVRLARSVVSASLLLINVLVSASEWACE